MGQPAERLSPRHAVGSDYDCGMLLRSPCRGPAAFLLALALGCGVHEAAAPLPPEPTLPISYVDPARGRDTNSGRSPQTAFQTLARGARELKPGWTLKLMSGTYSGDGTADPLIVDVSGTPEAWITIAAETGQRPVIQIPRGPGAYNGIHLLGASYVIVDGVEVVGQGPSITPAEAAANDGTQALFNHNCIYVDGVGYGTVHPQVPHDIVIRNTILHGCTAAGIEVNAGDSITVEHNEVYDNSWWTVSGTSGIGFYHLTDAPGAPKTGYRNIVVRNLVHGNRNNLPFAAGVPKAIYDGNGIIVDDSMHTQKALGSNDVQGVPYTGRTYIANNIVHDNGGRGIHVNLSQHVDVVNNTTWNDLLSTSDFLTWGEVDGFGSNDVRFVNNVCVNLVGKDLTFDEGNHYEYNLWDGVRAPYQGPHDILAPALLTDPAHGNFAPGAGSPALGSGTPTLAPPTDYTGAQRPAFAIDRGAVQVSR